MGRALSLHIGIDRVDPAHYRDADCNPWDGYLSSCENDADVMRAIAIQAGFEPTMLRSAEATRSAVIEAIRQRSSVLDAGDTLLISYAGHGGQLADLDGDEIDLLEETWCLYDGALLDDELYRLWQGIAYGVRVILVSDSCHSGAIMRSALKAGGAPEHCGRAANDGIARLMPTEVAIATYRAHRAFYDGLVQTGERGGLDCGVLTMAACKDSQYSWGNTDNGHFTMALNAAWANGATPGGYRQFISRIDSLVAAEVRALQTAQLTLTGNCGRDFIEGGIFAR